MAIIPIIQSQFVKNYHINIFYSEEDSGYIADVPDLAACSAFGATPEEALREILIAKTVWLEAAEAAGKQVPKPRSRPAIYQMLSQAAPRLLAPPSAGR